MDIKKGKNGIYDIYLYGIVGYDFSSLDFIRAFNLATSKIKKVNVRVNTVGGDVLEGIAIFNAIRNSGIEVTIYIDGLAASMGSVIVMAGNKILMSKYAKLMTHRVKGGAYGDADQLKNVAKNVEDVENDIIDIYAKRTGLSKKDIKNKYIKSGIDNWINASDAKNQGLIDDVYDGEPIDLPKDLSNQSDVKRFINQSIVNIKNKNKMKLILSKFGLPDNTSEEQLLSHINNELSKKDNKISDLENKLKDFETQEKTRRENEIKALIDNAIQQKKITESQRETFTNLANQDYENTKAAIEAMQGVAGINSQLDGNRSDNEERKDWKFDDYHQKAPEALAKMKTEDPEKYKKLYNERFGK